MNAERETVKIACFRCGLPAEMDAQIWMEGNTLDAFGEWIYIMIWQFLHPAGAVCHYRFFVKTKVKHGC